MIIINYKVFYLLQFDQYTPQITGQPLSNLHSAFLINLKYLTIDQVLDSNQYYWKFHILLLLAKYYYMYTGWKPVTKLENKWKLIDKFYINNPVKPQ